MKKMKKTIKYLCVVMISSLVLGVGLVVCGFCHTQPSYTPPAPPETLSAPSDLECLIGTWSSGETDYTLTWTGDKNASGYKIVIEKMGKTPIEKEVGAFVNEYDMTEHLVSGSQYRISVTAIGDGDKYLSSEKTETYCKAETPTKGLRYTKIKDGYEVSKGTSGYPTKQILPDLYNGVYVIKIADYGFGLPENTLAAPITTPVSVRLPKKLKAIGIHSFQRLVKLDNLEIPESVTEIGEYAFFVCEELKTNLPKSLTRIEDCAFANCAELGNMVFPETLTYIGEGAFYECKSITEIIIPDSVTYIGKDAFLKCENLEKIEISESLDYCGARMFNYTKWYDNQPDGFICFEDKLYSYKGAPQNGIIDSFPKGITEIVGFAFQDCENLISITIPEGCKSLDWEGVFYGCTSLQTVNLPSTLQRIGDDMFRNCTSLKEVAIPDNVEYIGVCAFSGCKQLQKIKIPSKIKTLKSNIFSSCHNLEEVVLNDNIEEIEGGAFQVCKSLKELNLPKNIKKIGDYVINNTQIESIVLPKSIEELNGFAFYRANALKEIYYCGSGQDWSKIQFYEGTELNTTATIYFYSETDPTTEGNYWHYDENGEVVIW